MDDHDRRTFLRLGGLAALGALAGCSGGDGGGSDDTPTDAGGTDTPAATTRPTTTAGGGSNPPGADQLGGPDDLRSSASVRAAVLDSDQGAGQFVFTPAVVWVETGATVSWTIEGAAHSVTAYHADNDRPTRLPAGAAAFDSGTLQGGETYERTFDAEGVYNYFCLPHEGLGMVGVVVVGGPQGGPGTTQPTGIESGAAREHLARQLRVAALLGSGGGGGQQYTWEDATLDSYWYSLYNMSTNIAMSGNGVLFPHNEDQQQAFEQRFPAMLQAAGEDKPPVKNPNLNMAAFTEGDPHFTQQPVLSGPDGRPDASTLQWDTSASSGVVSPSSAAWTHLKGVTWAKNFEAHFDVLPDSLAAEFRSMVLSTLAQIGVGATLVQGGPAGNGALTKGDSLQLVSGFRPADGTVVDATTRVHHHAAMLWFLSDLTSLATGGWFGYENPEPLVPAAKIQQLTDGMAKTTMTVFDPETAAGAASTRDLGVLLGATAWYGTQAGSDQLASMATEYANGVAAQLSARTDDNGRVREGAPNQAATQGAVGQGLLWASELDGVDHAGFAADVLGYMLDELWDEDAGTFASGSGDSTYTISARDAGDVTGGLNAADVVLGTSGVRETFARFFDQTFNRGRLQRAERPPSRSEDAEYTLPLPPAAGGEFGQAAVYNAAVQYDTTADEWSVTDDTFDTEQALYLANQDIWVGNWGGDFYQGRGVPGRSDTPP